MQLVQIIQPHTILYAICAIIQSHGGHNSPIASFIHQYYFFDWEKVKSETIYVINFLIRQIIKRGIRTNGRILRKLIRRILK